jgi:hypothetical protein
MRCHDDFDADDVVVEVNFDGDTATEVVKPGKQAAERVHQRGECQTNLIRVISLAWQGNTSRTGTLPFFGDFPPMGVTKFLYKKNSDNFSCAEAKFDAWFDQGDMHSRSFPLEVQVGTKTTTITLGRVF